MEEGGSDLLLETDRSRAGSSINSPTEHVPSNVVSSARTRSMEDSRKPLLKEEYRTYSLPTRNAQERIPDGSENKAQRDYDLRTISFCQMILILTYKNLTLARRNKFGVCLKLLLPAFFMGVMAMLRLIPGMQDNESAVYFSDPLWNYTLDYEHATQPAAWIGPVSCAMTEAYANYSSKWDAICTPPGIIAVTPDTQEIRDLFGIFEERWGEPWNITRLGQDTKCKGQTFGNRKFCTMSDDWSGCGCFAYASSLNFTEAMDELFVFYDSESDINDVIHKKFYGYGGWNTTYESKKAVRPISTAIVFEEYSDTLWKYKIRMNSSIVPSTKSKVDKFTRDYDDLLEQSYASYNWGKFGELQLFINYAITEYIARRANSTTSEQSSKSPSITQSELDDYTWNSIKAVIPMPTAQFKKDNYWAILNGTFMFFVALMCIYPAATSVSTLVSERAEKRKEGLMMVSGGNTLSFWLSWWLEFFVEATIITLVVVLVAFGGDVFRWSNPFIMFLWFWLFFVNLMSFATLISTWFDNPKIASLAGVVLVLVTLFSSGFSVNMSEASKGALCLLGPSCFSMSLDAVTQYETSLIGIQWDNINDTYNRFKFETCLIMLFWDTIIYLLLTLYFDATWPSQFGQRRPPHFLCLPDFYEPLLVKLGCMNDKRNDPEALARRIDRQSSVIKSHVYEEVDLETVGPATMTIRNLKKTFTDLLGRPTVKAVRGVNLDVYQDEVFCLLGHNGAGKTTTISMLIGMLPPSHGNAWLLGDEISEDMARIRRNLGVCLQHDVLWPRLTVREHLEMFARLKGVPTDTEIMGREVDYILKMVNLEDKQHNYATDMSGGQKRRLSLGIAFIGGSKLVFLDEPTSGQDPQSRRGTWELIMEQKFGRTIIYTTHELAEADVIGDRIAIMAEGSVRCIGTSMFLKQTYGVGYTLTVSLKDESMSVMNKKSSISSSIKRKTAGNGSNSLTIEDETGAASTAPSSQSLEKAATMKVKTSRKQIQKDIDDIVLSVPDSIAGSVAAGELMYKLPFTQTAEFPAMFDKLDTVKESGLIETYGVSVTTLEEVFLSINAHKSDDEVSAPEAAKSQFNDSTTNLSHSMFDPAEKLDFPMPDFQLDKQDFFTVFLIHVGAIIYRRMLWITRDFRSVFCFFICPFGYSCLVLATISIQIAVNNPYLELTNEQYDSRVSRYILPTSAYESTETVNNYITDPGWFDTWDEYMADYKWGNLDSETYSSTQTDGSIYNFSLQLDDTRTDDRDKHYTGFYFPSQQEYGSYAAINLSAYHSGPVMWNAMSNWLLKKEINSDAEIICGSHPLPVTDMEDALSSSITAFFAALFLMIAFSFIPAGAVYMIVNERSGLQKHQQLVSGVTIVSYWVSNFISDFMIGIPTCLMVWSAIYIFDVDAFKGTSSGPFIVTLLLFLSAVLPFTYCISRVFKNAAKAQAFCLLLFIILGLALTLCSFILDTASNSTRKTNRTLKKFYRIFPPYLMSDSLIQIAMKDFFNPGKSVWNWDVTGQNLLVSAGEFIGYLLLAIVIDIVNSRPQLLAKLGMVTNLPKSEDELNEELDDDVHSEKERIEEAVIIDSDANATAAAITGDAYMLDREVCNDSVVISHLRKVYPAPNDKAAPKVAVKDLNFGIPQGQCFGFLGVNGAGKSTTLAILTGERMPSSGTAFINGYPISNQIMCRRFIGYCPQFDALFELLTAREHLMFYGAVKGLKGEELEKQVRMLIDALALKKYEHKQAGTYSGGNKRKLSVAIAMIGNPPIVMLDEPSTGVDAESRREMWKFINATMQGRCVILTTHSMEECEALCSRLGIMVNGQLSCIGTRQHLKHKFGKGYQLDLELREEVDPFSMEEELRRHFAYVTLIEAHKKKQVWSIDGEFTIGFAFSAMEQLKKSLPINSYAVNQTTLEQIFVRMAREANVEAEV